MEEIKSKFPMRLDLQFFAEGRNDDDNPPADDETKEDGGHEGGEKKIEFTPEQQEYINQLIKERLDRDRKKREKEAEQKRLEEQNEYKKLYEQLKEEYEKLQDDIKAKTVDGLKTDLLVKAGYAPDQLDFVKSILRGETEEEIQAAIAEVKKHIPPKKQAIDPHPGNSKKEQAAPKGLEEKGRSLYERIKSKRGR